MRRAAVVCLLLLAAALSGCRSVWPFASAQKPPWVEAPAAGEESGRFLSATGVAGAGPSGEEMLAEADRAAREKLADAIAGYTREALASFLQTSPSYPPPTSPLSQELSSVLAAEVTASLLRQSIMQDGWQGPDGKAYVLYRLPVAMVNEQIAEKMRYGLRHVNPFGATADEAPGRMQTFLEGRLQERLAASARGRPPAPQMPAEYTTPAWLEVGRHESYPADRFFSAIGSGPDLGSGEAAARRELAARLDARLARLVETLQSPGSETALTKNLLWLDPRTIVFTEEDLVGSRIAERWHDPVTQTDYALAVLDRSTAAVVYRSAIRKARDRSVGLMTSARDREKVGDSAAALKDYLSALIAAQEAVRAQLRSGVAVTPAAADEFARMMAEPVLAQVEEALQPLLRNMTVEKMSGDRQWMPPGVPPRMPFRVRVTAGPAKKPVADVPLRLVLNPAAGTAAGGAVTDSAGSAQWQVQEALPEVPNNALVAELDLQSMAPEASLFRLNAPSAAFEYVLRSRASSDFVVYMRERTSGGRTVTTPLTDALKEALSAEGLHTVPDGDALKYARASDLRPDAPDAEVLEAFSDVAKAVGPDRFLLIVVGQSEVQLQDKARTAEGDLYIVYCPFTIRVLDASLPAGSEAVLKVTGRGKGAYLGNEGEAIRRARADAVTEAATLLVNGLREKLGPAPPR
jgi:hypothetical protein